ncbi:MAG TPA: 2-oxo-4-hydroxy-4-carboxy-5-ureidoimidazoline decarboxylase, partial [Candidatus Acidoferrales bacterium]|nr:2-oxo-4-hydroxy-4-carboxy-5-ureidoimidazoline decarboxylase [Candidatus Acidoferrales bacterium]
WVRGMLDALPFAGLPQFFQKAEQFFVELRREDWLEAFRHHPRIGEKKAAEAQSAQAQSWSKQEQAGVQGATAETQAALAEANCAYEARFGYIFLVCATGKTSDEMLALLRNRLQNDAEKEFHIAAGEQQKITRLRLEKLLER